MDYSCGSRCRGRSIATRHKVAAVAGLEDGKKLKMLKRHLQTSYGLSPDAYRAKWGSPRDYPMVAPSYAATRSGLAKKIGLGRRPAPAPEPEVVKLPARRAKGSRA